MFSTCSELTLRAPIPDGSMERIMQPWSTAFLLYVNILELAIHFAQWQHLSTNQTLTFWSKFSYYYAEKKHKQKNSLRF